MRMSNSHEYQGQRMISPRRVYFVVPGLGRLDQPGGHALAQAATLVWAAIVQREEFAVEIEDDNRAPVHIDQLALPRRDVSDRGNDVPRHQGMIAKSGYPFSDKIMLTN